MHPKTKEIMDKLEKSFNHFIIEQDGIYYVMPVKYLTDETAKQNLLSNSSLVFTKDGEVLKGGSK